MPPMLPLRVALTGAQGTGKSTLARALVDALRASGPYEVGGYIGIGHDAIQAGLPLGEHGAAGAVLAMERLHQAREAAADALADRQVQVFDRCLLDCLAYAEVLGGVPAAEFDALVQATQRSCSALRLLIAMRITGDYPVLTAQDESPAFRRAIEHAVGHWAGRLDLPLLPLALQSADMAATARALAACLAR